MKKSKEKEREYYSLENVPCESGYVKMEEGEEELFEEPRRDLKTPDDFYKALKRSLKMVDVLNRAIGAMPGVSGFGNARLITIYVMLKGVHVNPGATFEVRQINEGQLRMFMEIDGIKGGRCGDMEGDFEEQLHEAAEKLSKIVNEDFFEVKEISLLGD